MTNRNKAYDRPQFPVGVNLLCIREGKLLLGKRKGSGDGTWGLPGGHLEEGELMMDCAARELFEETGMSARSFRFAVVDNDYRDNEFHFVHLGFVAEGLEGEVELKEPDRCYEWRWFPLDQLPQPLFIGHEKSIHAYVSGANFFE